MGVHHPDGSELGWTDLDSIDEKMNETNKQRVKDLRDQLTEADKKLDLLGRMRDQLSAQLAELEAAITKAETDEAIRADREREKRTNRFVDHGMEFMGFEDRDGNPIKP